MPRTATRTEDCARALWLLGLEPPVSPRQLTSAWRERISRTHPDRHLGSERKAQAATVLTSALNDARALLSEWIRDGRPWPAPSGEADDGPGPPPPVRDAPAPVDRRTGLRSGDRVRLWPYDGEVVTVTGVERDIGDGSSWVVIDGGGAVRAERVRL